MSIQVISDTIEGGQVDEIMIEMLKQEIQEIRTNKLVDSMIDICLDRLDSDELEQYFKSKDFLQSGNNFNLHFVSPAIKALFELEKVGKEEGERLFAMCREELFNNQAFYQEAVNEMYSRV